MNDIVRRHVVQELTDYQQNRQLLVRITHEMKDGGLTNSREYLAILHRILAIKNGIVGCGWDGKMIYVLRYQKKLSWVMIAMKLSMSEATVKRHHAKLLESVAQSLGWI